MWRLDTEGPGPRWGVGCGEGIATIQERDAGGLDLCTLSSCQALSTPSVLLVAGSLQLMGLWEIESPFTVRPFSPRLPAVD